MSTPIRVSLLPLLIVCFCSTFGDSLRKSATLPDLPPQRSNVSNDLNIVAISIVNDMTLQAGRLSFTAVDQPAPYSLEPGVPYVQVVNTKLRFAHLFLDPFNPRCCDIARYDPKVDAGHQDVYWSVRVDGPYHSWDNRNWKRTTTWGNCN